MINQRELKDMPYSQAKTLLMKLNKIANQRMYRLKQKGIYSEAYIEGENHGKYKFDKEWDLIRIKSEIQIVSHFLDNETSTLTGFKKYKKELLADHPELSYILNNNETMRSYYYVYGMFNNEFPYLIDAIGYHRFVKIYEITKSETFERGKSTKLLNTLYNISKDIYSRTNGRPESASDELIRDILYENLKDNYPNVTRNKFDDMEFSNEI